MTANRALLTTLVAAVLAAASLAAVAAAKMQSERIEKRVCKTTGGGRFVDVPGFPGEQIDRRLLRDIEMMVRRYKIFITDGYSTDPVHSAKGEHPVGMALDIVPDRSRGGRWRDIGRLARWAEPEPDRPRAPFRWVGYNGDAGHGRGHHLHLSWDHSRARFGKPVRTAYSVRCPAPAAGAPKPQPKPPEGGGEKGDGGVEIPDGGGTSPGRGKQNGAAGKRGSGGVSPRDSRRIARQQSAASSRETGGVGLG